MAKISAHFNNGLRSQIMKWALGLNIFALWVLGMIDLLTGPDRNDFVSLIHTDNPINWLTSVNLIAAGLLSLKIVFRLWMDRNKLSLKLSFLWFLLACVFIFGGLDEWLDFHERIDGLISHSAIQTPLGSQIQEFFHGTYLLMFYAAGAVFVLGLLWPVLKKDAYSFLSFCMGLTCQMIALFCERFFQWTDSAPKPWVYITYLEEISELFGTMFFALSIFYIALNYRLVYPEKKIFS